MQNFWPEALLALRGTQNVGQKDEIATLEGEPALEVSKKNNFSIFL